MIVCGARTITAGYPPCVRRSEEHTSELQSHLISYAVFCLKKKKPSPKIRKHGQIKSLIIQRSNYQLLLITPPPHRIGSLPISYVFDALQRSSECAPPCSSSS